MKGDIQVNIEKIAKKKVSALVAEQIETMIKDGTFRPGEKLPSIRKLCELLMFEGRQCGDALLTLMAKALFI